MMVLNAARLLALNVLLLSSASGLAQFGTAVPLTTGSGGAYEVDLLLGDRESATASFLLDTGAALTSINGDVFKKLRKELDVAEVREVGARLADGRVRVFTVYSVSGLRLAGGCELGTIEAVVVPGSGRNLLGLNALQQLAPFTFSMNPPVLSVSGCGEDLMPVASAIPSAQ